MNVHILRPSNVGIETLKADIANFDHALTVTREAARRLARCVCTAANRDPDAVMDEDGTKLWEILFRKAMATAQTPQATE